MVEWIISDGLTGYDPAVAFMEARVAREVKGYLASRETESHDLADHSTLPRQNPTAS